MTIETIKKIIKEKTNQELEDRKDHYRSEEFYIATNAIYNDKGWVVSIEIEVEKHVKFELTNFRLIMEEELVELIEKAQQMKALF